MKINNSLTKRLFLITLSLMIIVMVVSYFTQAALFEKFYSYKRTMTLVNEVNRFSGLYSFHFSNDHQISDAIQTFEHDSNSRVLIVSRDNSKIYASNKLIADKEGINEVTSFCIELIQNKELISSVLEYSKTGYTTFYNKNSDLTNIGIVAPLSINSKNDNLIFCISSIQSIEEASIVIREFLFYLFLALVMLSAILALICSRLITDPLVTLTKLANRMSNMDFSAKCSTERNDEIGSLAYSLNTLSDNLRTALNDLTEKNKELEKDIEKERNLENMRKAFVDSVSHELKTPIGIIEGYAEGVKDGIVKGEDAALYLETIIDEAQKMGILVSNMLELSKLENGIIKLNKEDFNINRLIKKILNTHQLSFKEKKLNVSFIPCSDYSYIYADPFKIEQVMTNLITNAVKYTPTNNDINIIITEESEKYKIVIQNFGVNIKQNDLEHLFDKFYRIDKSRERTQNNSTGLGLSIVKNILELHECEFSFKTLENGLEFYFYIDKALPPEDF